ncbi:MAG: FecR domain-containing protein [Planctomycetes bacterium]|nr:FecR domain-containing protein [Planctomycetota bacterium]
MNEYDVLVSGYLENSLSEDEKERLNEALRGSGRLGDDLTELACVEGLLRAEFAPARLEEELIARVRICLEGHERQENVVDGVMAGIAGMLRGRAAGRRRWKHGWKALAAAAVVMIAAGAAFLRAHRSAGAEPVLASIVGAGGDAVITTSAGAAEGRPGKDIRAGDTVKTGAGGVELKLAGEETYFLLGADTGMVFPRGAGKKGGRLLTGTMEVKAAPQPAGTRLVVKTPNAEVEVVGTEFRIEVRSGSTRVDVTAGRVRMSRDDGASVEIGPGMYATARRGVAFEETPIVFMEAEAEDAALESPMAVRSDGNASGGSYASSGTGDAGRVVFTFETGTKARCRVWCRTLAPDSGADSFHVSMNGGPEAIFDLAEGKWSGEWQWSLLSERTGEREAATYYNVLRPVDYMLRAGRHELVFRCREAGSTLDKIIITSDPEYVPGE